jgi:hypothetical protein
VGAEEWVDGWVLGMGGWMGGFAKVDNRFGCEKWIQGGVRVGFININDMYNNDVGKRGVRVCDAYEVK